MLTPSNTKGRRNNQRTVMSGKSPISLLQEHCIVEFKHYPDYSYSSENMAQAQMFRCTCVINNLTTSSVASSKSNAKVAAAQEMINKLRIGVSSNGTQKHAGSSSQAINYVGILNEHCSKNRLQPVFTESQDGADFQITCTLTNYQSHGFGKNKKSAKQECAKKILELLKVAPLEQPDISTNAVDLVELHTPTNASTTSDIKPFSQPSLCKTNAADLKAFTTLITSNPVSALNELSQKNKDVLPDYLNCGKEGDTFKMKCLFRSFCACGSGITVMFAKQDSARKMLKILGYEVDENKQVTNLIDLCSATTIVDDKVPQISKIPLQVPSDKDVIHFYEQKLLQSPIKPVLQPPIKPHLVLAKKPECFKPEQASKVCPLENKLVGMGVTFSIKEEQRDPVILSLRGHKDGKDKHLLAYSSSYEDAREKLLKDAISSFS